MSYLKLLRVSSDGAAQKIDVYDWYSGYNPDGPMIGSVAMITNGDEGMVVTWEATHASADWSDWQPHMAVVSGGAASVVTPGGGFHTVTPVLQLEDGSFVGTASSGSYDPWAANQMIAFDSTGAVRWSAAGYSPKIATSGGGVLATNDTGSAVLFDENGSAVGMTGALLTQSWIGNTYEVGSILRRASIPAVLATSFAAAAGRNAALPLPDRVKAMYDVVGLTSPVLRNVTYRLYQGNNSYPPSKDAVIREDLLYSYGQHPLASHSDAGAEFDDEISTNGSGEFGLTQQFLAVLPGVRAYKVQIVPCAAPNTFGTPTPRNVITATSSAVLINDDGGSTAGRNCRYAQ